MTDYLIYFNQQWVGEPTAAELLERGKLAEAVVDDMRAAGIYLLAGGLLEEGVFSVEHAHGALRFREGRHVQTPQWLGGFAAIRVADEQAARAWAGRLAEACGWPQEVRRFV
ncbi:YciI family protein [Luteimonas sp. SDU82]|uniref:YciI family protein n=1 Tax=Luteimonas sp. SDU82 TaxID=3422592 RepID=UPI003EC0AEC8